MRTRGWALTSLGLFTGGFVAMWILDASLPPAANLTDPQLWLGTLALGVLALAGLAWKRSAPTRPVLAGAGAGVLAAGLLLAGFYGLLAAGGGGPTVHVHETNETPVAELDVETTRQQAPELAEALDELVGSDARQVLVTQDEDTFEAINRYLTDRIGDYNDPFTWRGTVARLDVIVS